MTDQSNTPWDLLAFYLSGEATEGEREVVQRWLEQSPEHKVLFERFRESWEDAANPVRPELDIGSVKQAVASRIMVSAGMAYQKGTENRVSKMEYSEGTFRNDTRKGGVFPGHSLRGWGMYLAIAAPLLLLVSVSGPQLFKHFVGYVTTTTQVTPQLREYTTANGERATVTLRDGTRITLNVASRLRVPAHYGNGSRSVFLDGEAQFNVSARDAAPFLVYAAGTTTRVLGTVFGIRAYPGASGVQVAVVQGKVSVRAPVVTVSPEITLAAGDRAVMSVDGQARVVHNQSIQRYLDWTSGELYLDEMLVSDALTQLARWYNLDFRIADSSFMSRHITLVVRGNTLTSIQLNEIAAVLDATAERHGRVITLTSKGSL